MTVCLCVTFQSGGVLTTVLQCIPRIPFEFIFVTLMCVCGSHNDHDDNHNDKLRKYLRDEIQFLFVDQPPSNVSKHARRNNCCKSSSVCFANWQHQSSTGGKFYRRPLYLHSLLPMEYDKCEPGDTTNQSRLHMSCTSFADISCQDNTKNRRDHSNRVGHIITHRVPQEFWSWLGHISPQHRVVCHRFGCLVGGQIVSRK